MGAPAVEWIIDKFGIDLSLVSRLGGHSMPRTHRGKERFPGMTITYGLMEALEEIAETEDGRARIMLKFLAAEALRGVGGVLLDITGNRFANELGRRDYVTGQMWKNKGLTLGGTTGFFLCLNSKASTEIT